MRGSIVPIESSRSLDINLTLPGIEAFCDGRKEGGKKRKRRKERKKWWRRKETRKWRLGGQRRGRWQSLFEMDFFSPPDAPPPTPYLVPPSRVKRSVRILAADWRALDIQWPNPLRASSTHRVVRVFFLDPLVFPSPRPFFLSPQLFTGARKSGKRAFVSLSLSLSLSLLSSPSSPLFFPFFFSLSLSFSTSFFRARGATHIAYNKHTLVLGDC